MSIQRPDRTRSTRARRCWRVEPLERRSLLAAVLEFSTYLAGSSDPFGGSAIDRATDLAVDSAGNVYVTGSTNATDFPTGAPWQASLSGARDAFVAKFSPAGELLFATYLGGSGDDFGVGIAVDATGSAYVVGTTFSDDFPTVQPLQPRRGGFSDMFVARLDPLGSRLLFSTYLGGRGTDDGLDIALPHGCLDACDAFLVGATGSPDFPTARAMQSQFRGGDSDTGDGGLTRPPSDAVVVRIDATGSKLVYATYFGGSGNDRGLAIAVDDRGNASITGGTSSNDLPTKSASQRRFGGRNDCRFPDPAIASNPDPCGDAFVARVRPRGGLRFATFLGGSGDDVGTGIAVDAQRNLYVTGFTESSDFPTTAAAFQPASIDDFPPFIGNAFVAGFNRSGQPTFSTYLGGSDVDIATDIVVDGSGVSYVTGYTSSVAGDGLTESFPQRDGLGTTNRGFNSDVFATQVSRDGTALGISTLLGGEISEFGFGIALRPSCVSECDIFLAGLTFSTDFPTVSAFQRALAPTSRQASFVARISRRTP